MIEQGRQVNDALAESESTELLPHAQPTIDANSSQLASLTAGIRDYATSNEALKLFLTHVVIYYAIAVIVFSFIEGRWSVIDSLYFATVLYTTIGYVSRHRPDCIKLERYSSICIIILYAHRYGDLVPQSQLEQISTVVRVLRCLSLSFLIHQQKLNSS